MDERMEALLKKRAERYARPPEQKKEDTSIGTFLGCGIGNIRIGIPSEMVLECSALTHWTPFSGRKYLLGLTHLRGDVMSLIDLLEAVAGHPSGKCLNMAVLQGSGGRFAVPIQEVLGLRVVEMGELLLQEQTPINSPLIFAATRDLWFLLNDQLLNSLSNLAGGT